MYETLVSPLSPRLEHTPGTPRRGPFLPDPKVDAMRTGRLYLLTSVLGSDTEGVPRTFLEVPRIHTQTLLPK